MDTQTYKHSKVKMRVLQFVVVNTPKIVKFCVKTSKLYNY